MTDQTTAATPGPGMAGPARKGTGPSPRDLAARAAAREAADHPGASRPFGAPSGCAGLGAERRSGGSGGPPPWVSTG